MPDFSIKKVLLLLFLFGNGAGLLVSGIGYWSMEQSRQHITSNCNACANWAASGPRAICLDAPCRRMKSPRSSAPGNTLLIPDKNGTT